MGSYLILIAVVMSRLLLQSWVAVAKDTSSYHYRDLPEISYRHHHSSKLESKLLSPGKYPNLARTVGLGGYWMQDVEWITIPKGFRVSFWPYRRFAGKVKHIDGPFVGEGPSHRHQWGSLIVERIGGKEKEISGSHSTDPAFFQVEGASIDVRLMNEKSGISEKLGDVAVNQGDSVDHRTPVLYGNIQGEGFLEKVTSDTAALGGGITSHTENQAPAEERQALNKKGDMLSFAGGIGPLLFSAQQQRDRGPRMIPVMEWQDGKDVWSASRLKIDYHHKNLRFPFPI